jgi:hypothetical protein
MSKKKEVPNEKETRKNLLGWARKYGCEADILRIFNRYDMLLKECKTPEERKAISTMGILELHQFFNPSNEGGLTINNEIIIEDPRRQNIDKNDNEKVKG